MKKRTRMISACAAVLLAAAPVVTPVATAHAETTHATAPSDATSNEIHVTPGDVDDITNHDVNVDVKVTNAASLTNGASAADATVDISSSQGTAKLLKDSKVYIVKATDKITDAASVQKAAVKALKTGVAYKAVATNVGVSGLANSTDYNVTLGDGTSKKLTSSNFGDLDNIGIVVGSEFALPDDQIPGTPYFTDGDSSKVITSAALDLDNTTVSAIKQAITSNVKAHGGDTKNTAYENYNLDSEIKAQLEAQGIKVDDNGSFTPKNKTFTFNYSVTFANGKSINLPITFTDKNFKESSSNPVFEVADDSLVSGKDGNYTWKNDVEQDSDLTADQVAKAFKAKANDKSDKSVDVTVDKNATTLNTKIPGTYNVVLTAKNEDGKTATATVVVKVVAKKTADDNKPDADKDNNKPDTDKDNNKPDANTPTATEKDMTVQYEADGQIAVYKKVDGHMVKSGLRVKNGSVLATFGQETVDGVSYTMIVNNRGSMYVQTRFLDGSYKPAARTTKVVMHAAYIYNKQGKRANESVLHAYSKLTVIGDVKTINNVNFYKVGHDQYVKAGNLDGTKRPLEHNAYVYNSKGHAIKVEARKATKHRKARYAKAIIKKGKILTTFGSRFKINGKEFYRVGKGQYIKAANFGKAIETKSAATQAAQANTNSGQSFVAQTPSANAQATQANDTNQSTK